MFSKFRKIAHQYGFTMSWKRFSTVTSQQGKFGSKLPFHKEPRFGCMSKNFSSKPSFDDYDSIIQQGSQQLKNSTNTSPWKNVLFYSSLGVLAKGTYDLGDSFFNYQISDMQSEDEKRMKIWSSFGLETLQDIQHSNLEQYFGENVQIITGTDISNFEIKSHSRLGIFFVDFAKDSKRRYMRCNLFYYGGLTELVFPIKGTNGSGTVHLEVYPKHGTWKKKQIYICKGNDVLMRKSTTGVEDRFGIPFKS